MNRTVHHSPRGPKPSRIRPLTNNRLMSAGVLYGITANHKTKLFVYRGNDYVARLKCNRQWIIELVTPKIKQALKIENWIVPLGCPLRFE